MLDIDDFKNINDTCGHLTGDDAIRTAGKILRNAIPDESIAARYGGDEFVVLTNVSTESEIVQIINKIEQAERKFQEDKSREYTLAFSKGYTLYDSDVDTVDTFLDRMDKEMYQTKKSRQNSI